MTRFGRKKGGSQAEEGQREAFRTFMWILAVVLGLGGFRIWSFVNR